MMPEPSDRAAIERHFGTDSEMARLMAEIDWSKHPLGQPDGWPVGLRVALRNLMHFPEPMYLVWGEDQSFFFNDSFLPILRPRLEGCIGGRFEDIWADFWPYIGPFYHKAIAGEPIRVIDRHFSIPRRGENIDQWWTFCIAPLFDEQGVIGGVQCVTTETTQNVLNAIAERRAAEALAESERSLHRAQEAGKIGIFFIDVATGQLNGNPEFFELFGLRPAPSIDSALLATIVLPEYLDLIMSQDPHREETIRPLVEYRIRRPSDGEIRWIERRGEVERDEQGRPLRMVAVVQDVTERETARAALAELNATLEERVRERTTERNLLARIFEETDNLVCVVDNDYRWLVFNRAGADEFKRVFGMEMTVGGRVYDALARVPEQRTAIYAAWGRALAGEEFTMTAEVGDRRLVPELRTYEFKFNVLRDEDGKQIGSFQIVSDITERVRADAAYRQMQETLRQSQKMDALGHLTGGVAHDFNNLLTPIIGSLDLIQSRSALSEREARLVDAALQAAERAKTLVQRLLAFARRQPLTPGPVDMAQLVVGMAALVASTSGPRIKVSTDVPEGLPPALGDHNQLEMAILNLCVNARDAMPDGGTITIAVRAETAPTPGVESLAPGDYVLLSVVDTGTGMDEETRRRAVEPFYSTKGIGKGTGLGLSMVDGLASQLGGTMTIASRPELGTRIDLWLPVSGARGSAPRPDNEESATARFKGRALVVDDEPAVRLTTADMLQDLGYDTEEAENARDAEKMLRSDKHFDLVVTDHLMPGESGAELALSIRRQWPGLPVLIVSGYAEAETIAPDVPRLSKPFREADLAKAIGLLH